MLKLAGRAFTTGVLTYRDEDPDSHRKQASIYIPLNIKQGSAPVTILAMLDTGAPYLIMGPEEIEAFDLKPAARAAQITMSTRLGSIQGFMDKLSLTIPAENGDSLEFEAAVFASTQWTKGVFVGYMGCMNNINFALQPQSSQFFFGPPTV